MVLHGVTRMDMNEKAIKNIIARLEKLERAVFTPGKGKKAKLVSTDKHQGASGGVKLLIENDYFAKKRTAVEVWQSLQEKGYHYKRQVVQVALLRLSKAGGPLVAMEEKGVKVYVNRK